MQIKIAKIVFLRWKVGAGERGGGVQKDLHGPRKRDSSDMKDRSRGQKEQEIGQKVERRQEGIETGGTGNIRGQGDRETENRRSRAQD